MFAEAVLPFAVQGDHQDMLPCICARLAEDCNRWKFHASVPSAEAPDAVLQLLAQDALLLMPQLRHLELEMGKCAELSDVTPLSLALRALPKLQHLQLNFNGCSQLSDLSPLSTVAGSLPELRVLDMDFHACRQVADITPLHNLWCAQTLQSLQAHFGMCSLIQDISSTMQALANCCQLHTLLLDLSHCEQVCDVSELRALGALPLLTELHVWLTRCPRIISVRGLSEAIRSLPQLQSLDIDCDGCHSVTDIHVLCGALGRNLNSITLDCFGCSVSTVVPLAEAVGALHSCKYLDLNFNSCHNIADVSPLCRPLCALKDQVKFLRATFGDCPKLANVAPLQTVLNIHRTTPTVCIHFDAPKAEALATTAKAQLQKTHHHGGGGGGRRGAGCFPAGTQVALPSGGRVSVGRLQPGTEVLSYHVGSGTVRTTKILHVDMFQVCMHCDVSWATSSA